jgi:hypothetical protein
MSVKDTAIPETNTQYSAIVLGATGNAEELAPHAQ